MALLNYIPGRTTGGDAYRVSQPVKSMASIVAICCAIGSFAVHNAGGKMLLAIVAVVAGLVGMLRAVSPSVSGGILSIIAIVLAVFGFLAAILDAVGLF